jgi:hypothetical protein
LYSCPIHWSQYNPIIQQLCSIYNCHQSDADFGVKVAGTGFHAGALAFCRIPPNIDPLTVASPRDFTIFEWELIDPKKLELEGVDVMDQRNVMYHYNPLDLKNPETFGGYFAIFVLMQLATSSSGNQQISVMVLNKLNSRASFSQPRPPRSLAAQLTFDAYEEILPNYPIFSVPSDAMMIQYMVAGVSPFMNAKNFAVQTRLDGISYTGIDYAPVHANVYLVDSPVGPHNNINLCNITTAGGSLAPYGNGYQIRNNDVPTGLDVVAAARYLSGANLQNAAGTCITQTNAMTWNNSFINVGNPPVPTSYLAHYLGLSGIVIPPAPLPIAGESILFFTTTSTIADGDLNGAYRSTQNDIMVYVLRKLASQYSWAPSSALIFTMVDRDTDLPITYVKLSFNGLLTVPAVTTNVIFSAYRFKLVFFSVGQASVPLPQQSSEMKRNYRMLQAAMANEKFESELTRLRARVATLE